jgi:type VI secretion system protein ImpE
LPHLTGTVNDAPFEDVCDLDDFLSHFLEIAAMNGKYYLIPFKEISSLSFHQPDKLQDQIWRSADLNLFGGFQGVVYVPTCYCKAPADESLSDALKLGGETNWISSAEDAPVRGVGQKTLLFGDNALSIMELEQFEIRETS